MILRFFPKLCFAAAASLYLFTLGVFQSRHRALIFQICRHFGWDRKRTEPQVPPVALETVLSNPLQAQVFHPAPKAGNVSLVELLVLTDLVRARRCEQVFEIGTFDGRTTLNLAAALGDRGRILTLDLPSALADETKFGLAKDEDAFVRKAQSGGLFAGSPQASRIVQLLGDSAVFDYSPYLGQVDLVFIDGSHAYDYVVSDSANALKLLRPSGGIILWHDYTGHWPELTHALNELCLNDSRFSGMRHIGGTSLVLLEVRS